MAISTILLTENWEPVLTDGKPNALIQVNTSCLIAVATDLPLTPEGITLDDAQDGRIMYLSTLSGVNVYARTRPGFSSASLTVNSW